MGVIENIKNWQTINNCEIDFDKYEPISIGDSLHVYSETYIIDNQVYRLSYAIGDDSNEVLIEKEC